MAKEIKTFEELLDDCKKNKSIMHLENALENYIITGGSSILNDFFRFILNNSLLIIENDNLIFKKRAIKSLKDLLKLAEKPLSKKILQEIIKNQKEVEDE